MLNRSSLGIQGYEVFCSSGYGYSLTFSGGELKSRERSGESGYGIRVLRKKQLGFSYCEKKENITKAAEHAAGLSKFSPKTGFGFPEKSPYKKLDVLDKKVRDITSGELKGILKQVQDGIERHSKKARIILSSGIERIALENSNGLHGEYESTGISVYCEAMCDDGFGFAYHDGIHMPKDFTAIGERAGRMAKTMQGAKKLKKGEYAVIFRHSAMDEILNILLPSFSGENKRKKTTILAKKLNKQAFSRKLSIYDNALERAGDCRPFDDEGTASRKRPLIDKGVIKSFIYDRETAALEGIRKSGFCSRAHYSAMPGSGTSNLVIGPGDHSDLEHELKDPLIVHSLHGSHTANSTTGDFGLEVNVAFHKGKPVRGFLLSGNIFKMLSGKIHLEKKTQMNSSLIAPLLAIEDVRVVS